MLPAPFRDFAEPDSDRRNEKYKRENLYRGQVSNSRRLKRKQGQWLHCVLVFISVYAFTLGQFARTAQGDMKFGFSELRFSSMIGCQIYLDNHLLCKIRSFV
mgnify:CR=1 FL=1